jgi:hypothetical protein
MDSTAFAGLCAKVESLFQSVGPRPWSAPRPANQGPVGDEYSRCLDPGKYLITQQRATAWASALVDSGIAISSRIGPRTLGHWGPVESTSLMSSRPGTEPLFLHFSSEYLPGVIIAYGNPDVVLTAQPVCGCDACDDGSGPLLEAIDEAFESVVLGEVLIEHSKRTAHLITRTGRSTSSTLDPDPNWVVGRWDGGPWLD